MSNNKDMSTARTRQRFTTFIDVFNLVKTVLTLSVKVLQSLS